MVVAVVQCVCVCVCLCRVDCSGPANEDSALPDGRESECPLRGDSATPVLESKVDEDSLSCRSDSDATVRGDSSTPKAWEMGEQQVGGEEGCGSEGGGCGTDKRLVTEAASVTEERCASEKGDDMVVGRVTEDGCVTMEGGVAEEGCVTEDGSVPEEGGGTGGQLRTEEEGSGSVSLEENSQSKGSGLSSVWTAVRGGFSVCV